MTRIRKSGSDEIGQVLAREPREASLTLETPELEALLARMFACGARHARSSEPRRGRTQCRKRTGTEWCRLGERTAGGERCIESKLG